MAPLVLAAVAISATPFVPDQSDPVGIGFSLIRSFPTIEGVIPGRAIDGIGDINADGQSDLVVGAAYAYPGGIAEAGSVLVYSGADGSELQRIDGTAPQQYLGRSVNGPGDLNGDTVPDFVVSAVERSPLHGRVTALSGADFTQIYTIEGGESSYAFGLALGDAPDHDGDGVRELLISRYDSSTGLPGYVDVRSGLDGSLIYSLGPLPQYGLMGALHGSPVGDFDGDGMADWGVYFSTFGVELCGVVGTHVFSGATGELIFAAPLEEEHCSLGFGDVIPAGDTNQDGFDDFWVVSEAFDCGGPQALGGVRLYLGPDGQLGFEQCGDSPYEEYGASAVPAEDVDCDGVGGIVVSAPRATEPLFGPTQSGALYLLRGSAPGFMDRIYGEEASGRLGWVLGNVGDVNGDGSADVAAISLVSGKSNSMHIFSVAGIPIQDYAHTTILEGAGFDSCAAPRVAKLQAWRTDADCPYQFVGIYIGGVNRWCEQRELTVDWVMQAGLAGWKLAPIWAGPSPLCRRTRGVVMSSDPVTAYSQGAAEAQAAAAEVHALWLDEEDGVGSVIYYDMEAFETSYTGGACTDPQGAAQAASAFIQGWSKELRALGHQPGVYGHAKNAAPWFSLPEPPEVVWLARYSYQDWKWDEEENRWKGIYQYDRNATVWDIAGVPNCYWRNHQRIFQYNNTHTEVYGGRALSIDSNVADGRVANPWQIGAAAAAPLREDPRPAEVPAGLGRVVIERMGMVSPTEGWVLTGRSLLWSQDAGRTWRDRTPPEADDEVLLEAEFLDPLEGWVVSAQPSQTYSTVGLSLHKTADGGQNWQAQGLPTFDETAFPQSAHVEFINENVGWVVVRLGSSSNSSDGVLLHTTDGGQTWTERTAPSGNAVRFIDANRGWALAGAGRNSLLETTDGGVTWSEVPNLIPPEIDPRDEIFDLPVFDNTNDGLLPLILSDASETFLLLYRTQNGGDTWMPFGAEQLEDDISPSSPFPVEVIDSQHWFVAGGSGSAPQRSLPSAVDLSGLAGPVVELAFASPDVGWVAIAGSFCDEVGGELTCQPLSGLYATEDGGTTWEQRTLPGWSLYLPLVYR